MSRCDGLPSHFFELELLRVIDTDLCHKRLITLRTALKCLWYHHHAYVVDICKKSCIP